MPSVVRFRGAVVLLGQFPALAGIDLHVAPGETVLLRGPNGAGKTTLLRACGGLVPVVDGEAEVLGCDIRADARPVRRRVAYAGPGDGLYDDLTVHDNVMFWTRAAGVPSESGEAALEVFGLAERLRHVPVSRLSTGQRRRTALAVLVARRPQLWLLDEPHAGLDQAGRDLVDDLIGRATASGATVLLASHELDRAAAVADRSITIAGGVVRADERLSPPTPTKSPVPSAPEISRAR